MTTTLNEDMLSFALQDLTSETGTIHEDVGIGVLGLDQLLSGQAIDIAIKAAGRPSLWSSEGAAFEVGFRLGLYAVLTGKLKTPEHIKVYTLRRK